MSSVVNIAPDEKRSVFLHLLISVFVGTSEENSSFRIRGAIAADMKAKGIQWQTGTSTATLNSLFTVKTWGAFLWETSF